MSLQLLAFLSALALLVCNTAAGLAGRLAGSLTLAAATVLSAVAQIAGFNRLDMFHNFTFYNKFKWIKFSTMYFICQSHFSYFSYFSLCVTISGYAQISAHFHSSIYWRAIFKSQSELKKQHKIRTKYAVTSVFFSYNML